MLFAACPTDFISVVLIHSTIEGKGLRLLTRGVTTNPLGSNGILSWQTVRKTPPELIVERLSATDVLDNQYCWLLVPDSSLAGPVFPFSSRHP
ncbi:hypothetical protein K474DRAFT_455614 [Panus rudis PR-1116 ss-1]|nr:hypothetical protein K474DRAFT_455614 [Panus rudis PR-1116 ss-1]